MIFVHINLFAHLPSRSLQSDLSFFKRWCCRNDNDDVDDDNDEDDDNDDDKLVETKET